MKGVPEAQESLMMMIKAHTYSQVYISRHLCVQVLGNREL